MTGRRTCLAVLIAAGLAIGPGPVGAEPLLPGALLARALDEARAGNWVGASAFAGRTGSRVATDIVVWSRLRDGIGGWEEYADFLARNGDWPGLATVRRQGERKLPAGAAPETIVDFFGDADPQTGTGALRLATALTALDRAGEAEAVLEAGWPTLSLTAREQAALLERHPALDERAVERADALLWDERLTEAERLRPLLDSGWQALMAARIALRRDAGNVDSLIAAVPAALQDDPGMAFERFAWRVRKGRWDDAEAWIAQHSTSAETLGRPEAWMARRPGLARRALERGEVEAAYALVAGNFGTAGADYAESEWLAGYIALARMDDPKVATAHFERLEAAVLTPISLGRAAYWLGRAHAAAGDDEAARAAYARGAQHQTSFYGQLAAEAAGMDPDPALSGAPVPDWQSHPMRRSRAIQAGELFVLAGDEWRAMQFFRHAAETMDAEARAALAQMQIDSGRPHLGVRLAKDAAGAGMVIPAQYYPTHAIAESEWSVPAEFALAIARQESEFNPRAISSAGARGLMQLMPATAEDVSKRLGIGYDPSRLTDDPDYNAQLGTTYLGQMLDNYGGSYILAAAAYNAGPGRVSRWLKEFGDPRKGEIDAVTWIETIPFTETRTYVMRVLEALHVYRARLDGETRPVQLLADINRRAG